jgi:GxxExxY protein
MAELLFKKEVYTIVGAAFDVYNELGEGFLEAVYQEALETEFALRQIPYVFQQEIQVIYKGKPLKKSYVADFVAFGKVVVEIKAIDHLTTREYSQVINYLKATNYQVGVIINFGSEKELEWKRVVNTPRPKG